MHLSQRGSIALAALLTVVASTAAFGDDPPPPAQGGTVSRADYEALQKQVAELQKQMAELRQQKAATGTGDGNADVAALREEIATLRKTQEQRMKDAEEYSDEIMKIVKDVKDQARANTAGSTELLITGDANAGFDAHRNATSTFQAGVAPRFLWKLNDQMYFDAALDIGLGRDDQGNNSTDISLEIATFNYAVCNNLVVGVGEFVVPFAAYHRYFDPAWIDKLPDDPLVFSDGGLAPGSALGAFASGGYTFSNGMRVNYAAYLDNGPELSGSDGSISFDNHNDLNNNKAVGGRIGFLPLPELEIGYSVQYGQVNPDSRVSPDFPTGTGKLNAVLQAVDLNYSKQFAPIGGTVTGHAEWVWSHVQGASYPNPDPTVTTPVLFDNNNRNGGYVQLSYRPTLASIKILRNVEFVERYDRMDVPTNDLGGGHEQRWTTGLDYWIDAKTVVKFAYECDDIANASGASAYLFQIGMGF